MRFVRLLSLRPLSSSSPSAFGTGEVEIRNARDSVAACIFVEWHREGAG
jgi:hypothetical protein